MARNIIHFELRAGKDDDIADALEKMITVENTKSNIARTALRYYLLQQGNQSREERATITPQELNITLKEKEKDDSDLEVDLDDLLKF